MSKDIHKYHSLPPDTYKIMTKIENGDLEQRVESRSYSKGGLTKKVTSKVSLGEWIDRPGRKKSMGSGHQWEAITGSGDTTDPMLTPLQEPRALCGRGLESGQADRTVLWAMKTHLVSTLQWTMRPSPKAGGPLLTNLKISDKYVLRFCSWLTEPKTQRSFNH